MNQKSNPNRFIYTDEDIAGIRIIHSMKNIQEQNQNHSFTTHDLVKALADISSGETRKEDLSEAFEEVAVLLLRMTKIVTPKNHYFLREIEIYFYKPDEHKDIYTHKRPRQLQFGEWYFHRFKTLAPFLKSYRNGLDITFGNEQAGVYGGILIRSIQDMESGEIISGINKVVRTLLNTIDNDEEKVNHLALEEGHLAFDRTAPIHLEVAGNNYTLPIYKTQRFLATRKDDDMDNYYEAAYRYYNHSSILPNRIEIRPAV